MRKLFALLAALLLTSWAHAAAPVITTLLSPNPASGNVTTDGTLQTLASAASAAGVYSLEFDLTNLADGDCLTFTVLIKVNGSATEHQRDYLQVCDGGKSNISFGPYATPADIAFKVQRTAGSDHAYQWSVLNYTGS